MVVIAARVTANPTGFMPSLTMELDPSLQVDQPSDGLDVHLRHRGADSPHDVLPYKGMLRVTDLRSRLMPCVCTCRCCRHRVGSTLRAFMGASPRARPRNCGTIHSRTRKSAAIAGNKL